MQVFEKWFVTSVALMTTVFMFSTPAWAESTTSESSVETKIEESGQNVEDESVGTSSADPTQPQPTLQTQPQPRPQPAPPTVDERVETKSETTETEVRTRREEDRFGAYLSFWGDPFPTTVGVNLAYNITDYLRANAGAGSDDTDNIELNTVGVGLKAFVPGWEFSPVVGLNLSNSAAGDTPRSIRGFDPAGFRFYGNLGVDWQTGAAFYFGAGHTLSLRGNEGGTFYLNAGLFL